MSCAYVGDELKLSYLDNNLDGNEHDTPELDPGLMEDFNDTTPSMEALVDSLCLPPNLDPEYYRDFDHNIAQRFCELEQRHALADDPSFGSNESLLQVAIDPSAGTHGNSIISWDSHTSQLWQCSGHFHRAIEGETDLGTKQEALASKSSQDEAIRTVLMPWETFGSDLECSEVAEGSKFSQTIGISFPKLDFANRQKQFRLLVLLPSLGDIDAPLEARLIVSTLYLHSCFTALRHTRGNPGCRGEIKIDGNHVVITQNLEVFLRNIRHPTRWLVLYIRELCINRDDDLEYTKLLNGHFHALVEDCSCGVIDMSQIMEMLDDEGLIDEPVRATKKHWHEAVQSDEAPWHMPVPLKRYSDNIPEAQAAMNIDERPIYEYLPLDLVSREIRLLAVYPAEDPQDPIVVDVVYAPLRSAFTTYFALSYCWGSPKITHYLRAWKSKIGIPENLHKALLEFRSNILEGNLPCFIWADAVCIDQENDRERNRSIPRMHDVYEAAVVVMVFIAPPNIITDSAVQVLEAFANDDIDRNNDDKGIDELASLDAWADLYSLFRLPYFGRRWIIQELTSASAPSTPMGGTNAPRAFRTFSRAAAFMAFRSAELISRWNQTEHPIMHRYDELQQIAYGNTTMTSSAATNLVNRYFQQVKTLDYIRSLKMEDIELSFLFLIVLFQHTKCADPHDRLYSLSNISKEKPYSILRASYQDSTEDCYLKFTRFYITETQSLDIICISQCPAKGNHIELCQNLSWNLDLDIPSWCPDYRQDDLVSPLVRRTFIQGGRHLLYAQPNMDHAPYHADKIDDQEEQSVEVSFVDQMMFAYGIILDTIEFVSSLPVNNTLTSDLKDVNSQWLNDILNLLLLDDERIDGDECSKLSNTDQIEATAPYNPKITPRSRNQQGYNALLSAYLSMIVGERSGIVEAQVDLSKLREHGTLSYSWSDDSEFQDIEFFEARAAKVIKGRRLIVTKNGYMGLAPWHVRKGFQLAILRGCSVPVLLETISEETASLMTYGGETIADSERETFKAAYRNVKPGWHFRGDCFVQGWMEGEMIKSYGSTTQEAWERLSGLENRLVIH